jgi:hypothetical protein
VQKNSTTKSSDNHPETNQTTTASSTKITKIQRASESVWSRILGVYFRSRKDGGQGSKNPENEAAAKTTISWAVGPTPLQPVAEITCSGPEIICCFQAISGYLFL